MGLRSFTRAGVTLASLASCSLATAAPYFEAYQDMVGEFIISNVGNPNEGNPNLLLVGLDVKATSERPLKLESFRPVMKNNGQPFEVVHADTRRVAQGTLDVGWDFQPNERVGDLRIGRVGGNVPDIDRSTFIDLTDFSLLKAGFGKTSDAILGDGDVNGDGKVDLTDFGELRSDFGKDVNAMLSIQVMLPPEKPGDLYTLYPVQIMPSSGPTLVDITPPKGIAPTVGSGAAIPEPSTLLLAGLGAIGVSVMGVVLRPTKASH